jgi:hypothetical protein
LTITTVEQITFHDTKIKHFTRTNIDDSQLTKIPFPALNDMKVHDQKACTENMKKFHKAMQLCIYQCTVCREAWPLKTRAKEVSSSFQLRTQ